MKNKFTIAENNDFENKFIDRCSSITRDEWSDVKINVVIMVKDQKDSICNVIKSALNITDKVWVTDTGSTDGTKELVENVFKNKVIFDCINWVEDYSYMRNLTISRLPDREWVFIIDSDEVLKTDISQLDLKKFLYFCNESFPNNEIVLTIRQEADDNKIINRPQRIFKKTAKLKFYGYVHEELRSENMVTIGTMVTVFNQGTSKIEYNRFNKFNRYNCLLLKNIKKEPDYIKWFALLDYTYGVEHMDNYYERLNYFYKNIKKSSKLKSNSVDDVFEMKLLATKIGSEIEKAHFLNAQNDVSFAMNYFKENTLFYYYKYFIKIAQLQNNASYIFRELRNDIASLKDNKECSEIPAIIQLDKHMLEEITVKLLFKIEKYDLALSLMENNNSCENTLIEPEMSFINRIRGDR